MEAIAFVAIMVSAGSAFFFVGEILKKFRPRNPDEIICEMWDDWREELSHISEGVSLSIEVGAGKETSLQFVKHLTSELRICWQPVGCSEQAWAAPKARQMAAAPLYPTLYAEVKRVAERERAKKQEEIKAQTNPLLEEMRAADKRVTRR